MNAPRTARARARAELTIEIKEAARRQLAEVGAPGLSVRAIARELGMASSAVYRYFPGRDELLTALIVDAYGEVASAAEASVAKTAGQLLPSRWVGLACEIRDWAVANPNEYALIYGSPVPGYAAPTDTVEPAQRLSKSMVGLLADAWTTGEIVSTTNLPDPDGALALIRGLSEVELSNDAIRRGLAAWTQLFGHLSFELFGQFHTVVEDYEEFFIGQMKVAADSL